MPEGSTRARYSVSGLMVYEVCPRQYYHTFVRGWAPPITAAMQRGTTIHALIKDHFGQPRLLVPDAAPEVQSMFETFRSSRFNIQPLATEQSFVLPFESGDVRGRIDLVLPGDNTAVEVIDFKSGTTRSRQDMESSLQLPLYALAATTMFDARPEDLLYTYYFLRQGEEISFRASTATFATLRPRVESLVAGIQAERFESPRGCGCFACRRVKTWRQQRREAR